MMCKTHFHAYDIASNCCIVYFPTFFRRKVNLIKIQQKSWEKEENFVAQRSPTTRASTSTRTSRKTTIKNQTDT